MLLWEKKQIFSEGFHFLAIIIIIIIIIIIGEFFSSANADDFPTGVLVAKSLLKSQNFLNILANLNNVEVSMVLLFHDTPGPLPIIRWPYRQRQFQMVSSSPSGSLNYLIL